jgi:hypothetical protein
VLVIRFVVSLEEEVMLLLELILLELVKVLSIALKLVVSLVKGIEEDVEGLELLLVKIFELVMILVLVLIDVHMSVSFVVRFAKTDICVCVRQML